MEIKHAGSYNQGPTWPRGTNNIIKKQLSIQLIDAMQIGAMRKQKNSNACVWPQIQIQKRFVAVTADSEVWRGGSRRPE